jgi:site-specific DNA recombinase
VDAGRHPTPAKAADGKRLHKLDLDLAAAPVVKRIFAEFTAGHGFYAIAEGLTRDDIPSPSAHDPERNKHRSGIAWNKFAVRSILVNPRYTGHQVWNKQRKDEVLIDVEDVALGHTTKLRWNDTDKWLWSEKIVQPPIIDKEDFERVQAMVAGRAHAPAAHKPHPAKRPYQLRGCVWCGVCGRRMQSHWVHDTAYYRCRFPAEYALANCVQHPRSITLREGLIVGEVDQWLAREFRPHRMTETIRDLFDNQPGDEHQSASQPQAAAKIAACEQKLTQYRAALDAGASPVTVAAWIAETEPEKAKYEASQRQVIKARKRMTEQGIRSIVDKLADIAHVLSDADPDDKSEIFRQLGLKLTYHPGRKIVEAKIELEPRRFFECVRGGT